MSFVTRLDIPSDLVRPVDIRTCVASISPSFSSCLRVDARRWAVRVMCLYALPVTSYIAPRPTFSYSEGWYHRVVSPVTGRLKLAYIGMSCVMA